MIEKVEIVSPPLQLECLVCRQTTGPFQSVRDIKVEKSDIPFGVLDEIEWRRPGGEPYKKDEINTIPSICPSCHAKGHTLEEFNIRGAVDWLPEKEVEEEVVYYGS